MSARDESNGGTLIIGNASPQASTVGSNMTLNGPVTITNLIGGLGSLTLSGNLLEGGTASSVTKTGNTLLVLAGNNTYAGHDHGQRRNASARRRHDQWSSGLTGDRQQREPSVQSHRYDDACQQHQR